MSRISFDYPNTCPKIDRAISGAQATIDSFLCDLLDEACPLLPAKERDRLSAEYSESLYAKLEDAFETVRSTNVDMRSEAEDQIELLGEKLTDLEAEVDRLKEAT